MPQGGVIEVQRLEEAGFTPQEISDWQNEQMQQMLGSGFSSKEVNDYFGIKQFDKEGFRKQFLSNVEKNFSAKLQVHPLQDQNQDQSAETLQGQVSVPPEPLTGQQSVEPKKESVPQTTPETATDPKVASSFIEFLEAGFDQSVIGLMAQGAPDVVPPENVGMFYRLLGGAATLAGDFPAMVAGSFIGGTATGIAAATTALTPAAPVAPAIAASAPFVAGGTAFALPAAIRTWYMESLEKGEVPDWSTFWENIGGIVLESSKAFATGALTLGAGKLASKALKPIAAAPIVTLGSVASEAATLTTVGSALEGHMPRGQDFLDASVLLLGLKGATKLAGVGAAQSARVASKARNIWRRTQTSPEQMSRHAETDPHLYQDIVAENVEVPKAYENISDPKIPRVTEELPTENISKGLKEPSNITGSEIGATIRNEKLPPSPKNESRKFEGKSPEEIKVLERMRPGNEGGNQPLLDIDKIYTNYKDDLYPVKQFTKALTGKVKLEPAEDPYILARLTRGNHGRAEQTLTLAPYEFHTGENAKGVLALTKVLDSVPDLDGFRAFMGAKRFLEKSEQGINTGLKITKTEALKIINAGEKQYGDAFQKWVNYHNHLLKFAKDAGLFSEKEYRRILEANLDYVPWNRYFENATNKKQPTGLGRDFIVSKTARVMKGSDLPVIDPIETTFRKTQFTIAMAEKNRVLQTLVDLAIKTGNFGKGELVERVPSPKQKVTVTAKEIINHIEKEGFPRDAEDLEGLLGNLDIFRAGKQKLRADEFMLFRDGKAEVYRVPEAVATALRATGSRVGPHSLFLDFLALPAKMRRIGVTSSPDFVARNAFRDQIMSFSLSKHGVIPFVDFFKAIGSILKQDAEWQNFLKSGAANSTLADFDRLYLKSDIYALSKKTGLLESAWNIVKNPMELGRVSQELEAMRSEMLRLAKRGEVFQQTIMRPMEKLTSTVENASRLAATKKVPTEGLTNIERLYRQGIEGREVTLDFGRLGAKTIAWNRITSFWNAHVEGLDRLARAFKERPQHTTEKMVQSITFPSVLLWFANHDDPRWKDIPRWQKDNFWILMTDDHVYRVPKPFEPGLIFGSMVERALDFALTDNPKALTDFKETLIRGIIPDYIPTIAEPVIEQFANRSLFTDSKIIPQSLEKVMPPYQYTDYTTETAKALGRLTSKIVGDFNQISSPIILQNYVRSWGGTLGMYALNLSDELLIATGAVPDPVRPQDKLEDIPFIRSFFIRLNTNGNQQIADFYDNLDKTRSIQATFNTLLKTGEVEDAQGLMLKYKEFILTDIEGTANMLASTSKFIRNIYRNPEISPKEKRDMIDNIMHNRIEAARMANKIFEEQIKLINKDLKKVGAK